MKEWMRFLKKSIVDEQQREDLRLWLGALLRGERSCRVLCLLSNYSSPKILVLELLSSLVGYQNCIEHFDLTTRLSASRMADLKGLRLITTREYQAKDLITITTNIKRLTSNEPIVCNAIGQEFEIYKPTWSLALLINELPPLDVDKALDARLLKINMQICADVDLHLWDFTAKKKAQLKAWATAI
jgi:phage/plasmid-associated DNA primase